MQLIIDENKQVNTQQQKKDRGGKSGAKEDGSEEEKKLLRAVRGRSGRWPPSTTWLCELRVQPHHLEEMLQDLLRSPWHYRVPAANTKSSTPFINQAALSARSVWLERVSVIASFGDDLIYNQFLVGWRWRGVRVKGRKGTFIPLREKSTALTWFQQCLVFYIQEGEHPWNPHWQEQLIRGRLQTSECDLPGLPLSRGAGLSLPLVQISILSTAVQ